MKIEIKRLLKERKESVSSFAERIGITQANMSNIVNGKANPSLHTLEKMSKALNVPISVILGEDIQHFENEISCPHCGKSIKIKVE